MFAAAASTMMNQGTASQPLPVSLPQTCNADWLMQRLSPIEYTPGPPYDFIVTPDPVFKVSDSLHKTFLYDKFPLCNLVGKYDISNLSGLSNLNLDKFEIDKGTLDKGIFVLKARAAIAPVELAADLAGRVRAECGILETGDLSLSGHLTLKNVVITLNITAKIGLVNGVYTSEFIVDDVVHKIEHIDFKINGITSLITNPLFGIIESIVKKDALLKLDAFVEEGLKKDLKRSFPRCLACQKRLHL